MKKRNRLFILCMSIITLGVYALFWFLATKEEMEREGVGVPNTAWLLVPVVNLWWLWRYAKAVETITKTTGKRRSGTGVFSLIVVFNIFAPSVIQKYFNNAKKEKNEYYSLLQTMTKTALYVATVTILILGQVYYFTDYASSEKVNNRRFWSAIDAAMKTQSVVKTSTAGASGKLDTNKQRIYLSDQRLIHVNYKTEVNNPAQSYKLTVETEALQYLDGRNYIRYTNYESTEGTSLGGFINQWGLQETPEDNIDEYKQQFVGGLVSVVPFANLRSDIRSEIIQSMKDQNIYRFKTQDIITQDDSGEEVVIIPIVIALREYLQVLNKVYTASGYPDLGLDPEQAGDNTLAATIQIRTKDNVVTKLAYGNIVESYSNYGVVNRPEEPTSVISYEELQKAVQQRLSPVN